MLRMRIQLLLLFTLVVVLMDPADAKRRPTVGRPKPNGGRPKPSGGRPKPTGGRPKPTGGRPKPTGGRPKPTVVKPVPGPLQPSDMACMCSLPFPSNTSMEATSRSLVTMLDRFGGLAGLTGAIGGQLTGPVPSVGRSLGDSLPPVVNALITVLLAGLSALAAYGKLSVLAELPGGEGRAGEIEAQERDWLVALISRVLPTSEEEKVSQAAKLLNRFGLGSIGSIIGVTVPALPEVTVPEVPSLPSGGSDLLEGLISEWLGGGGVESLLASLLEGQQMAGMVGGLVEMVSEQMQNIDSEVWGTAMDTLAGSLAGDLGQMMAGIHQLVKGVGAGEALGGAEGLITGALGSIPIEDLKMMMDCSCKKP